MEDVRICDIQYLLHLFRGFLDSFLEYFASFLLERVSVVRVHCRRRITMILVFRGKRVSNYLVPTFPFKIHNNNILQLKRGKFLRTLEEINYDLRMITTVNSTIILQFTLQTFQLRSTLFVHILTY